MDKLEELVLLLYRDLAGISLIQLAKDDDRLVAIRCDLFSSCMGLDGIYSHIGCSHDFSCYLHLCPANIRHF